MDAKGRAVRRCRAARWRLWRSGGGKQAGKGRGTVGEEWMSDGDASGAETTAAALAVSVGWVARSCTGVHSLRPPIRFLASAAASYFALRLHRAAPRRGRPRRDSGGSRSGKRRREARDGSDCWTGEAMGQGKIGFARFWPALPRFAWICMVKGRPWKTGGPSALSERGWEPGVAMPRRYRRRYGPWAPAAGSGSAAHPGPRPARGR